MIAFVHIPKTAGSTLRTIFLASHQRRAIGNSGNAFRSPESCVAKLRRLMRPGLPVSIEVVAGHTPYGLFREHLPHDTRYVTILREPVDMTLSHFHFLELPQEYDSIAMPTREGPRVLPMPPRVTLEEMLRDGLYILDNPCTRLLCDRATPFGPLTGEHLAQAKRNLAAFAFVGIAERFDESVVLLERALRMKMVPYESRKVNPLRPRLDKASAETVAMIRRMNRLDMQLYAFARDRFDAAVRTERGLERDVEELRRASVDAAAGAERYRKNIEERTGV